MKTVGTVLKILAALAAVAGAIYVVATYGDKIVAWVIKVFRIPEKCCCGCEDCEDCEDCECDFCDVCEDGEEDFEAE